MHSAAVNFLFLLQNPDIASPTDLTLDLLGVGRFMKMTQFALIRTGGSLGIQIY